MDTQERIEIIKLQNDMRMHLNSNFFNSPFANIEDEIVNVFTEYWKEDIHIKDVYDMLYELGLDDDDVDHIFDNMFLNEGDC